MKKLILIISVLFATIANAQDIKEVSTKYNRVAVPGVEASFKYSKDVVETALNNYLEKTLKKSKSSKGYNIYENVSWTEVSDPPLSAFTKVDGDKNASTVTMLISTPTMAFYSSLSNSNYMDNLKSFLSKFESEIAKVQKEQDIAAQMDEVKKIEDKISRNQKDASKLQSEKEKIEKDIINNAKDLEDLNKKLQEEKDKLEKVKN